MKREGVLRHGGDAKRFELDHTAYRLFRVVPRSADSVTLRVRAARGVRTGIALVGRDGRRGDRHRDQEPRLPATRRQGHRSSSTGAQDFERITAVVTNADGRVRRSRSGGRRYTRNNERFRARLR